jgi:hypothetical protein
VNDCVGQCAGKGGVQTCLCGGSGRAKDAAAYLQKRLLRAEEALSFYADPENYHAISFLLDRPCGGFADDFSEDHGHADYERPMPGKLAREVLSTPVPP